MFWGYSLFHINFQSVGRSSIRFVDFFKVSCNLRHYKTCASHKNLIWYFGITACCSDMANQYIEFESGLFICPYLYEIIIRPSQMHRCKYFIAFLVVSLSSMVYLPDSIARMQCPLLLALGLRFKQDFF